MLDKTSASCTKPCQNNFPRARRRDIDQMLANIPHKLREVHYCILNSRKQWPVLLLNFSREANSSASQFGTSFFQAECPHLLILVKFSFAWPHSHNYTLKLLSCKVNIRLNCCCIKQYRQNWNCPTATPIFFLYISWNCHLKDEQEISFPSFIPLQFSSFSPRLLLLFWYTQEGHKNEY